MDLTRMFNMLIDDLSEKRLLNTDNETRLRELNLNSYQRLIDLLNPDGDKQTTLALSYMIGCSRFVKHELDWSEVIPFLVRLLSSSDWEIRLQAAETIGRIDAYDQLQTLAALATSDKNDDVRVIAIDAIAHWHLPKSAPLLIPIANDTNEDVRVREAAIEALGVSGSSEAVIALIALLRDKEPLIRYVSVIGLHNARDPIAIPHLEKLLTDKFTTSYGVSMADSVRETIRYLSSIN